MGPHLHHRHYHSTIRAEISPAEWLALTIRYLATGNSQVRVLSHNLSKHTLISCTGFNVIFRVGRSTVCYILEETCKVIYEY